MSVLGCGLVVLASCRSSAPPEGTRSVAAEAVHGLYAPPEPEIVPAPAVALEPDVTHRVRDLEITVLSTKLAPRGIGEWGFAALVEADGQRILFDTGARRDTVLRNAKTLGIDLESVPLVVLSHHHGDHVGGLIALRRKVAEHEPTALATVHVAQGIFEPRRNGTKPRQVNGMLSIRPAFEASGGRFVVHEGPAEIAPGVWVTGPVPRVHDERNWSGQRRISVAGGWAEDTLPESQSLVIDTDEGLIVLSGCGHAGIINTIAHARATIRSAPIHAAIGGFHLLDANAEHLAWTGEELEAVGIEHFGGAHCTGQDAVRSFRELASLSAERSTELGVGERFVLP